MKSVRMLVLLAFAAIGIAGSVAPAASCLRRAGRVRRPASGLRRDVFEPSYLAGCSGHDEPELNPPRRCPARARTSPGRSSCPTTDRTSAWMRSARLLVWRAGRRSLQSVRTGVPGAAVLSQRRCLQLQPQRCLRAQPVSGDYTVCSPVWSIHATGQKPNYHEPAAFNALLTRSGSTHAMVMHAGDTVDVHYFVTAAKDGWHIRVSDRTTGQSGTIVLNSKSDGPLMPSYSVSKLGNSLSGAPCRTRRSRCVGDRTRRRSPVRAARSAGPVRPAATPTTHRRGPTSHRQDPERDVRGRLSSQ
jgi:hypothetical protein